MCAYTSMREKRLSILVRELFREGSRNLGSVEKFYNAQLVGETASAGKRGAYDKSGVIDFSGSGFPSGNLLFGHFRQSFNVKEETSCY